MNSLTRHRIERYVGTWCATLANIGAVIAPHPANEIARRARLMIAVTHDEPNRRRGSGA